MVVVCGRYFGTSIRTRWDFFFIFLSKKVGFLCGPRCKKLDFYEIIVFFIYLIDALHSSHPIEVEVGHPSEVAEIFDTITYNKGASIIRMLHSYIGAENFQKGLQHYLNEYKYGNAITMNLWESFEKVSGEKVCQIMSTWTKQKGFPVVEVVQRREPESDRVILDITQKKFSLESCQSTGKNCNKTLWSIPITVCTGRHPDTEKTVHLLDEECRQIILENVKSSEWVKVNVKSVGFYHVLYESNHLQELLPAVESKSLSSLDRWRCQFFFIFL